MINKIQNNAAMPGGLQKPKENISNDQDDFKNTLQGFLEDVNSMQHEAQDTSEAFVKGEITDLHQVTISTQKARLSLELLLEVRNKVMDSYQEIMRMQL